jgi:protease IV
MIPNPPHGQGPIDLQGAFVPPLTPAEAAAARSTGGSDVGGVSMNPTPGPQSSPTMPNPVPAGGQGFPPGYPPGWPMMPFYPPPQKRGGIGRLLLTLGLVLMLGLSFLVNLVLMGGVGSGGDESMVVSQVVRKGDDKQRIAVVEVSGPIDGNTSGRFARLMDQVERESNIHGLVIEVDSPGGTVTASDEIYDRILRYKTARTNAGRAPNVVITMRSMATSGGYYVSCAGDYIFAEQTTLTGNIGVLWPRYNFSELMKKHGVEETTVVATGADYKNLGSPFAPETEEGKAYLKGIVDDAFTRFKQVVTAGRGAAISGKDIFNGRVFTAADAQKNGLVDALGYPNDAYNYAAAKATLNNPQVVRFREPRPGLLGMLVGGTEANAATPTPSAQSFDLSSITRPETLDAWRSSRLLYR